MNDIDDARQFFHRINAVHVDLKSVFFKGDVLTTPPDELFQCRMGDRLFDLVTVHAGVLSDQSLLLVAEMLMERNRSYVIPFASVPSTHWKQ